MSSRNIRARLDRLTKALAEQRVDQPVCRFHGTACRMGANWPVGRPPAPDELLDLIITIRMARGLPAGPHPRDVWATDAHERVPNDELQEQERETEELVAGMCAKNDQLLAQLRTDRDANLMIMNEGA